MGWPPAPALFAMQILLVRHAIADVKLDAVIGGILGHTRAQTTQRYAHLAISPLLAAADLVSAEIAAALEGRTGELVKLER